MIWRNGLKPVRVQQLNLMFWLNELRLTGITQWELHDKPSELQRRNLGLWFYRGIVVRFPAGEVISYVHPKPSTSSGGPGSFLFDGYRWLFHQGVNMTAKFHIFTQVKNQWSYTSILQYAFVECIQTNYNPGTLYTSISQPLWDRGPVNSFFIRRGPVYNKFTRKYLSIFWSSYIKLT
jgi:hypothetical protein